LSVNPDGHARTGQRLNMLNRMVITQARSESIGLPLIVNPSCHGGISAGISCVATVGQTKTSYSPSSAPSGFHARAAASSARQNSVRVALPTVVA
jgi:hypothetical protein